MKKRAFAAALAALLFTACESKQESSEVTQVSYSTISESTAQITDNVIDAAVLESAQISENELFSEYSLELKGAKENYMAIIRRGEFDDEISVTLEDNRYQSSSFVITAPSGYEPYFPYSQSQASSVASVISNDITDEYIPDIISFTFYITQEELDNNPDMAYSVNRMYTIDKNGELREITVKSGKDDDSDDEELSHIFDEAYLYHTEPDKFIYGIIIDDNNIYDEDGNAVPVPERVTIKTLTFDSSVPCFVTGEEEISEENPLYFGYAHWAAANTVAQYFIMTTFNISDWDNYVEKTDLTTGSSEYYFRIDDSRFETVSDLLPYLETVFTESTAKSILNDAPQKYCDIDGHLYGIAGDGGIDYTLGTLTFSDYDVSDDRMIFRSRQEKFTEDGESAGYTDGGNFVIVRQQDGSWRVSQYRYPYASN